jgi:MerR family mercuric resistance operon transcriptional regulator
MEGLKRGELAKKAGVNITTLRYYEKNGLLQKPRRTSKNYRIYSNDAYHRIRFIKSFQEFGFSLEEIKNLIRFQSSPAARCEDVLRIIKSKIIELDSKIRTLQLMKKALAKLGARCPGKGPASDCPVFETVEDGQFHVK